MKQILLYRHAKAQKRAENLADFVRQLTSDGVRQASSVGRKLREKNLLPDHVLSSDAVRAMQTAEITKQYSKSTAEIEDVPELYEATTTTFLDTLSKQPDSRNRVALVGHNPTIEEFLKTMLGKETEMKTGCLAVLEANIESWADLAQGKPIKLREVIRP
jgi:phosphohistidine phosphatase